MPACTCMHAHNVYICKHAVYNTNETQLTICVVNVLVKYREW